MVADVSSMSAIIMMMTNPSSYVSATVHQGARGVLLEMQQAGVSPSSITLCALLNAYAR